MKQTPPSSPKRNTVIYWIATIWLALGMSSSGIVQLIHLQEEVDMFSRLGYPAYLLTLLGLWKILGVIALLAPRAVVFKEWAYAGFFFTASGALYSHAAVSDPAAEMFGPCLLLVLIAVSWYFRPADRKYP
jgi:uncharacterized membrane protein YphA (DoxX/SURF4 family)